MEIVAARSMNFCYPDGNFKLGDLDFSVDEGELLLLCGESGCGKTTLLRLLKPELSPCGKRGGELKFFGGAAENLSERDSAAKIGYVGQDPEIGAVTETVMSELAFLPQNLGLPRQQILRDAAEVTAYFGLEELIDRPFAELSSGQKQLVNLAAVMVGKPKLLLLDEPISRLDPRSAQTLIDIIDRMRREFGTAVIVSEHDLNEIFTRCDRVLYLENGRQKFFLPPEKVAQRLRGSAIEEALPLPYRLSAALGLEKTLRSNAQVAQFLAENFEREPVGNCEKSSDGEPALEFRRVAYRYEKHSRDVICDLTMTANFGELTAVVGANGTGKTTLLRLAADLIRPTDGKIYAAGKPLKSYRRGELYRKFLAMLPSDVHAFFSERTIMEDLERAPDGGKRPRERIFDAADRVGLDRNLLGSHSLDLSGGELQRAAFVKLLLLEPKIILLDEPTAGLDISAKSRLAALLREFAAGGGAAIFVTHDLEFAARYCDRAVMLFGGRAAAEDSAERFFAQNSLYTTSASLAARRVFPNCVTSERLIKKCEEKFFDKGE